jgi:hypothetical protein
VGSKDDEASVDERLFGALLDESHFAGPDDVVALVARHARLIGARDVVLYLADYEQQTLMPVQAPTAPDRRPVPIETTLAGRAFRMIEPLDSETASGRRVWLPLLDGSDRLGVMELTIPHLDDRLRARCRQLAALAAIGGEQRRIR